MNKILKAADEVKKLHRMFKALGEVVDVLDAVGSLEQAEGEAKARIARINDEVSAAQEAIVEARSQAAVIVSAGEAKADELLAAAEQSARQLLEEAEAKVVAANASADSIIATAQIGVENLTAKGADIKAQHDALSAEVAELENRAEKARAYLAKLAS